jgi:hypothetical protein
MRGTFSVREGKRRLRAARVVVPEGACHAKPEGIVRAQQAPLK